MTSLKIKTSEVLKRINTKRIEFLGNKQMQTSEV